MKTCTEKFMRTRGSQSSTSIHILSLRFENLCRSSTSLMNLKFEQLFFLILVFLKDNFFQGMQKALQLSTFKNQLSLICFYNEDLQVHFYSLIRNESCWPSRVFSPHCRLCSSLLIVLNLRNSILKPGILSDSLKISLFLIYARRIIC